MRDAVRENEAQGASHPPLHKTKISLTFYSRDSINHPSTTFISICRLLLTTLVKKRNRAQRYPSQTDPHYKRTATMKLSLTAIIIPLLVSVGMAAPVQVVRFSLSSNLASSSVQ